MSWLFPSRQWSSKLRAFSGAVVGSLAFDSVQQIPYPGALLKGFRYIAGPGPHVFNVGVPITPLVPTYLPPGAPVINYRVAPNLPDGLTLNRATGEISGTPTTITAAADYEVTAVAAYPYKYSLTMEVQP